MQLELINSSISFPQFAGVIGPFRYMHSSYIWEFIILLLRFTKTHIFLSIFCLLVLLVPSLSGRSKRKENPAVFLKHINWKPERIIIMRDDKFLAEFHMYKKNLMESMGDITLNNNNEMRNEEQMHTLLLI